MFWFRLSRPSRFLSQSSVNRFLVFHSLIHPYLHTWVAFACVTNSSDAKHDLNCFMWFHYDPELQTDCTMKKSPQGDSRGAITRKACFWKICCLTSGGCNFVWAPSPHQSWQMADPTCTCFCWTFLPGKRAFFFPLFPVRAHRESSNLGGVVPAFWRVFSVRVHVWSYCEIVKNLNDHSEGSVSNSRGLHSCCSRSKGGVGGWDISRRCSVLPAYQHLSPLERMRANLGPSNPDLTQSIAGGRMGGD